MRKATNIYKALSDPNRLRILMMLKKKPMCVCEIVEILDLANSTVSKHLSILRNANLIIDEKDGRWVNYQLADISESQDIDFVLSHLAKQLDGDDQIKKDSARLKHVDRYLICATPAATTGETE